ncbi:TatD family hydrolase [Aminipila sp.]|uniref:TatD family hydrolase n=1 Tax=Aminipila sp. TaxID=2060095 RepID=UPI002896CD23|nr:TatD family hydrolase [Aminipila sp.]
MIIDSHTHMDTGNGLGIGIENSNPKELAEFRNMIREKKLGVLANASCVSEFEAFETIEGAFISFGIHPWNTHEFCKSGKGENPLILDEQDWVKCIREKLEGVKEYFRGAHAVGEIGMDSVWCSCNLMLQRELFIQQVEIAQSLRKPVVLHTKGQEKAIAEILLNYSLKKLVHWYSCEQYLELFLEQDCYFTVGPNYQTSNAVKKVISTVPLDRLLVETDGISAVEWASEKKIRVAEIPDVLKGSVRAIAEAKGIAPEIAERRIEENFYRFLGI